MEDIKKMVKQKYGQIALQTKKQNETSCCGEGGSCSGVDYTIFSEDYKNLKGYNPDADLGLGCGLPTQFAEIHEGDTVIDLGSGAGNDCFIARELTGAEGTVIGIDMTEAMIEKANENTKKLGFTNVHFRMGDIEKMPVTANKADVVISNCVLNLVPDKEQAFAEIYRVLKQDGHFSISDVVLQGSLPEPLIEAAEMYSGCVTGAIQKEEYIHIIRNAGFSNIQIQKEKEIHIPDEILLNYLNEQELKDFRGSGTGIFSITVYAKKSACGCAEC